MFTSLKYPAMHGGAVLRVLLASVAAIAGATLTVTQVSAGPADDCWSYASKPVHWGGSYIESIAQGACDTNKDQLRLRGWMTRNGVTVNEGAASSCTQC